MKVRIEKTAQTTEIDFVGKASELLQKLDVNQEEIIIVRNGELITPEDTINDDDTVEILSVVSGG